MANKHKQNSKIPQTYDTTISEAYVDEIRRKLRESRSKENAAQLRKLIKSDVDLYGVNHTDTHKIGLDCVRKLRSDGLAQTLHIADQLYQSHKHEEALIGAQLVGALSRLITASDFEKVSHWVDHVFSPQTADSLAISCYSACLAAKPSLVKTMREWARSENPYKRRTAIASFNPLVREGRFLTDALEVAEILMSDNDIDVQRGVGVMLLEATRLQPDRVITFLASWKDSLSSTIQSIATSKLRPDQKNQLREK
ncbi:MAG: hypothetical protein CL763_04555 [Chloroflexi bacterium]|nr:hypothetical protein [Chloroflexota bacterium]|tara:strand:+ start:4988 stop:5749 length:762 start_codon:yes stop_codon:yes gene_type:complete